MMLDTPQTGGSVQSFRLRRHFRNVGILCAVCFAAAGVVSTLYAYINPNSEFIRPRLAMLVFGLGWSSFVCLAVWLIAAYYRERLFLTERAIVQHGVIGRCTLEVSDVLRIEWHERPLDGSITVR